MPFIHCDLTCSTCNHHQCFQFSFGSIVQGVCEVCIPLELLANVVVSMEEPFLCLVSAFEFHFEKYQMTRIIKEED